MDEFKKRHSLKLWTVPFIIAVLSAFLAFIDGQSQSVFPYNRIDILSGDVWRPLSGHFIHLGWSHYSLNIAGLLAVWFVYGRYMTTRSWVVGFVGLSLAISACFLAFNPELKQYVGLSGVLYGVLCMVLLKIIFDPSERSGSRLFYFGSIVIFAYVILRILYEQLFGQIAFSTKATGGNVIVDAHLYGVIFGCLFGLCLAWKNRKKDA